MKYVLNNVFYKPKEGLTPFKESINTFSKMNAEGLFQLNLPN